MKDLRNSEKLYDRYADAVTALVMEQYASAMAESLEAEERAPVEVSAELDSRCRKLIKKGYAKQLRRSIGKKLLRATSVAAVVFLVLCGVFAVLFSTVEAIRVPIVNYFVEQQKEKPENSGSSPEADAAASGRNYLEGLTPADYKLAEFSDQDDMLHVLYRNSAGETICFDLYPKADALEQDDSGTETEALTIGGCDATLTAKDGHQQIVWSCDGEESVCRLETSAINREELIALAEAIESSRGGTPSVESDLEAVLPPEDKAAGCGYSPPETEPIINIPQTDHVVCDAFAFEEIPHVDIAEIDVNGAIAQSIVDSDFYATLFDRIDDQFVWSSVDGEETGDDSVDWTVLP